MSKITDYTSAARFDSGDVLIKDGTNGTKKITVENAASELAGLISATKHRDIFRGKNLGTAITAAQLAAIQAGTFDDLFIGDYWTINSVRYEIADMDYWYQIGDTAFTNHHIVVVPRYNMYTAQMNTSDTTTGGYIDSAMKTTNLGAAETAITNAFTLDGTSHVLTHRSYYTTSTSAGSWVDSTVDLMNENMVYGSPIRGNEKSVATSDKTQLALFRLNPKSMAGFSDSETRAGYWLRDIYSAENFALMYSDGGAYYRGASNSRGVRPAFAVG